MLERSDGLWRLYFHRSNAPVVDENLLLVRNREVLDRASARLTIGQPFLIGPDGRADQRVNQWFTADGMRGSSPATWRKYAYSLLIWLNFLAAYGRTWDDADSKCVEALKCWRMTDERNPVLVAPGTFHNNLVALRLFYTWAAREFDVANPIRMRRALGRRRDGSMAERPTTAPAAIRDRDVKWFDPAGYVRYRDLGLGGFTAEGVDDSGFRGRNGQRDAAFADGLYGTGLRLQEWGSVLLLELPNDDRHRDFMTCRLAAATAKYSRGRRYWMPRRYLGQVLAYVEGERAGVVRRAREKGRYLRIDGARTIVELCAGNRVRVRDGSGHVADVAVDSLAPRARRRLLVETPDGIEPAALWLNEDGLSRDPHGWEHTFHNANRRLARMGFVGFAGTPHMLRHSFALRWYAVGRLLYEARYAHLTQDELRDFREQFGDAWDLVQMLLGHADQATTREIYLEPFRSLEIEQLLMHAAQAAVPQLLSTIMCDDRRVLSDPLIGTR